MDLHALISPQGELEREVLFPDDSAAEFEDRLETYQEDALLKQPDATDDAVVSWIHYRAYSAVLVRMSATPGRADMEEGGSYSFLVSQMNFIKDRADYWLVEWTRLTTTAEASVEGARHRASTSIQNVFFP
jgi:hypothetical protein